MTRLEYKGSEFESLRNVIVNFTRAENIPEVARRLLENSVKAELLILKIDHCFPIREH